MKYNWGPTNPFAVDVRSLAALRVGLSLCLLWELGERLPDLGAFYSDAGLLPRADFLMFSADRASASLSLAFMGGALWSQILLFAATAAAATALLVGYRTCLSAFLCWLLLSSIQLRNPFVVFDAGAFLRMLLFWGMFLPLGARFSMDRRLAQAEAPQAKSIFSVATCGLSLQIAIVFVGAGLAKLVHPMWGEGLGVAYSLDYEPVTTQLGGVLAQFPAFCSLIGYAVIIIELGGTVLLFSPVFAAPLRIIALAAMAAMLAGFGLTLRVGLFPWVAFAALLAFVPSSLWDRFGAFPEAAWRPAPVPASHQAGSRQGRGAEGRGTPVFAYAANGLAVAAIAFIFLWNIGRWRDADYRPPAGVALFGQILNLRQQWGMFIRLPSTGWLRIPGTLRDGTTVELLSAGGPLPEYGEAVAGSLQDRPQLVSATFRSVPWLIFLLRITENPNSASDQLGGYARYLCRQWNLREVGVRQLEKFEVIYMYRPVDPSPATGERQYERQVLGEQHCFG